MKSLFALAIVLSAIGAVSPSFAEPRSKQLSSQTSDDKCQNPFDFHCPPVNGG